MKVTQFIPIVFTLGVMAFAPLPMWRPKGSKLPDHIEFTDDLPEEKDELFEIRQLDAQCAAIARHYNKAWAESIRYFNENPEAKKERENLLAQHILGAVKAGKEKAEYKSPKKAYLLESYAARDEIEPVDPDEDKKLSLELLKSLGFDS